MKLSYAESEETAVTVALTTIVTALAINSAPRGSSLP